MGRIRLAGGTSVRLGDWQGQSLYGEVGLNVAGILPELPWRNEVYGLRASTYEDGSEYTRAIKMSLTEVEARIADWTEEQEIPEDDCYAAYAAYSAGEWELAVELACKSLGTAAVVRRELWAKMTQHTRTKLRKRQTQLRSEQPGHHTKPTR